LSEYEEAGIMKPTRVLAINLGGIGDEILFLPARENVRKAVPDCDLTAMPLNKYEGLAS
jgi:hypothetical protein